MVILQKIALIFTIIGAIAWGIIGIFDFNIVTFIFGESTLLTQIVYIIVGVSGIVNIGLLFQNIYIK